MGKLAAFGISFAEDRTVFFPGNVIAGNLFVQLNSPMEMKAIRVKFVGRAHVHWSEQHSTGSGKNRRTETRHYSATENLFEQCVIVYGEGSADPRGSLPQGQHTFPFQFQLPAPLPSSYEDHIGYIRYHIKGTIVKPWKFDHNTKRAFTVLDSLDLNTMPNMMAPVGKSGSKTLCCLCCKSDPIQLEFHIDRTGYVPGEMIYINATLTNGSNSQVKGTSAHLIQEVRYHATTKSRTDRRIVATIAGPECRPHGSITWSNERLQIPPVPPSESAHCRIIDINYYVQFEAHLRTFAINLREDALITVGTVPLRSLEMYGNAHGVEQPPEMPREVPSAPPAAGLQPTQYSAPPPSYTAATGEYADIKDDDDNEYTMGETTFAPQYTFYDWSQSAFTYNK